MNTATIGVKQLYKELKNIARDTKKGKSFLVMNRSEPLFRIEPVVVKPQKSMDDLFKIHFSGDKNLSKDIDKILYGAKK
jgi:hypothetical protein